MNHNKDVFETNWDKFRGKVFNRWNKGRKDRFDKVNSARERSISILQRRYGYTREQATYQLDTHYSGAWLG
jgi:uncharacterized protein YjbJ (UPF0337 family)